MKDKSVLIDYRASTEIKGNLANMGITVICTSSCNNLPWQVNGHPDMVYHRVTEKLACVAPDCFTDLMKAFSLHKNIFEGRVFIKGDTTLGRDYPKDVPYNLLRIGNRIFGKLAATDKKLLKAIEEEGIELVDVKQGYAKCSVAVVSETSAITSDAGLIKELEHHGIQSLYLEPGGIVLPGYEYGFIGGASGLLENTFFLTGKYEQDSINKRIEEFVDEMGVHIVYLSNEKIVDLGSILEA